MTTPPPPGYTPPATQTYRSRAAYVASQGAQQVNVPGGIPKFVGNSAVIVFAWLVAMALVVWDEWHNNDILARPSRLWWTTLVYGILALVGMSGPLLPIANALAIGYTIVLAYQYFNGNGEFSANSDGGGGGGGKR